MRTEPSGAPFRLTWALVAGGSDVHPLGPPGRVGAAAAPGPGAWPRSLAQERGVQLGMTFLDGTSIRAHQKAAGAARKGALQLNGTPVRRWAARVGAMGPRRA